MQPRALVPGGHFREALGGFENEIFGEADFHGGVLYRGQSASPIYFHEDFVLALVPSEWHVLRLH
jgi:hypothetical protein